MKQPLNKVEILLCQDEHKNKVYHSFGLTERKLYKIIKKLQKKIAKKKKKGISHCYSPLQRVTFHTKLASRILY